MPDETEEKGEQPSKYVLAPHQTVTTRVTAIASHHPCAMLCALSFRALITTDHCSSLKPMRCMKSRREMFAHRFFKPDVLNEAPCLQHTYCRKNVLMISHVLNTFEHTVRHEQKKV